MGAGQERACAFVARAHGMTSGTGHGQARGWGLHVWSTPPTSTTPCKHQLQKQLSKHTPL